MNTLSPSSLPPFLSSSLPLTVIPAQAGIQPTLAALLDPRLRGDDA